MDFTGTESELKLTLKHRYNFDYYAGMGTAYNGGQVLISTDKAVRPTNIMGASKRLAELIVLAYGQKANERKSKNPIRKKW